MQWLSLESSRHPGYAFTGDFYNPGPYACFFATTFPFILRMALKPERALQKLVGIGLVTLGVILIPATLSRTAIAACVAGGVVACADRLNLKLRSISHTHLAFLVVTAILVSAGAYYIKKDSADGRWLMWKVAASAACEAPAHGVGWDKVAGAYGEAQERYFAGADRSEAEMMVADAPEYVFNEYLQVAIAYGIPVVIAMTVIMAGALTAAIRARAYGYAGAATAVAVVMTASYPLQFPLFVVMIALIFAGCYLTSRRPLVMTAGTAAVACAAILFLYNDSKADVESEFAAGHALHRAGKYRESNRILLNLLSHTADPMVLNIIGKNYQSMGQPDSAEYYLLRSVNRCPNRLYPHYLLMQLYADTASHDKAAMLREARILTDKKEKIASPAVMEMRAKARQLLNADSI